MRVGLSLRRSVCGKRRPQITKTRRRDHTKAGSHEPVTKFDSLIEAAAGSMYDEHRLAITCFGELDRPGARDRDPAASQNPRPRRIADGTVPGVSESAQTHTSDYRNDHSLSTQVTPLNESIIVGR